MEFTSDFLVLGSGIAGLSFAIKASGLGTVTMVTKKEKSESNTNYAQGGIAVVLDREDSFEDHIRDTLVCGGGLCREDTVRFVVSEGPDRIRELVQWGVDFTKSANGSSSGYDLGREGGHSKRRVIHAKDLTGREIERALHEKASHIPNIRIFENHISIDLILQSVLTQKHTGRRAGSLPGGLRLRHKQQRNSYIPGPVRRFSHRRRREGLSHHDQSGYCHGRRHRHGLPRRGRNLQHGVHPVSPDLSLPSGSQILSYQ